MPESSIGNRLEDIVNSLGRYYGAISRNDFVSMLLLRSESMPSTLFETPDPSPARVAAQALLDVTEGGFTTPTLIQRINDFVTIASSDNDIPDLIKICYEPALLRDGDQAANIVLRDETRPHVRKPDSSTVRQGHKKNTDEASEAFSIKHVGGFGSGATRSAERANITINETGTPTSDTSHVDCSIIQVFANRLAPASRDMGALTLFLNAIPTLEISRAVPFIDMVLIQEGDHFNASADGKNRIVSLSLGQFLLGAEEVRDGTLQKTILGANDAEIVVDNASLPEFERTTRDRDGTERTVRSPIATAGMELFTSPQTMVNADEEHLELDDLSSIADAQVRRQAPVIDKFRPLMSLKSVSFQVVGTGGMMSYKSAKMSLVLHDRSRLADISALVRPSRFGTTHIMLEYGWAHPDSPVQTGFTSLNRDNLYGALIGALRVKEKYQIVNSSFDFDDSGQVNIELQLSMLANRAMQRAQIGLGLDNVPAFQEVKYLTDMIQELRSRISPATAMAVFGEADVLGSLTNPQGALTPLSSDVVREIRNLSSLRTTGTSPDLRRLGEALSNLMGASASGGAASDLRNQMRQQITRRIDQLVRTSDPFLVPGVPNGAHGTNNVAFPRYISLGKIFASFVLEPVAASGHYKDVQIIFYNFNDKASYMANRNIATFPISKADFTDVLTRELDQLVNMPIESFINFVGTYFISDPGADAYGFNSTYGSRSSEPDGDSQRQLTDQYRENDARLFNKQQEIMRDAYGRSDGELEFKHPTVSVILESVPVRGEDGTPDQTILRMHIVDSQATAHTTMQSFLEAASSQTIGLLNTSAMAAQQALGRSSAPTEGNDTETPSAASALDDFQRTLREAVNVGLLEQYPSQALRETLRSDGTPLERYRIRGGFSTLKSFLMRTVPSARYGEGSSGILSAKVTSMNDSALSTVNMLRQGRSPENPIGSREQGVPLQVSPVECILETIGCPLWSFGQQIFLDFGTGTTIDAIYGVTGVDHTIEQGSFKSTVKLTPMNTYARYTSLINNVENALVAINELSNADPPLRIPAPPPRPPRRPRVPEPPSEAERRVIDYSLMHFGARPLNPFEASLVADGEDPRPLEDSDTRIREEARITDTRAVLGAERARQRRDELRAERRRLERRIGELRNLIRPGFSRSASDVQNWRNEIRTSEARIQQIDEDLATA